jgi:ABC-type phosphate transport system substrate-binding protein
MVMNTNKKNGAKRSAVTAGVVAAMIAAAPMAVTAQATVYELHGSGTTNPSKFFWWAMDQLEERAGTPVRMSYRSVGSGTGEQDWKVDPIASGALRHSGAFASTDYGLNPNDADYRAVHGVPTSGTGGGGFFQIPFQLGAVSFFHNVPGVKTGEMKLSACTLAKIFNKDITSWDHADIKSDTGLSLPAEPIKVAFRNKGSSSTFGVQGYVEAGCTDVSVNNRVVDGKPFTNLATAALTDDETYLSVDGSDTMRKAIGDNAYSIGYLDAGHGHADDLPEVALKNQEGEWVVTKEGYTEGDFISADIEAVLTDTFVDSLPWSSGAAANWADVNLFNKAGSKTWPICAFTYVHLRKSYSTGTSNAGWSTETPHLVHSFVEFILSDEGQTKLEEFLFFKLPSTMLAKARLALADSTSTNDFQSSTNSVPWKFEDGTNKDMSGDELGVTDEAKTLVTMGEKTFSKKRQTFADYERELMMGDIEAIIATIKRVHPGIEISTDPDADNGSMLTLKDKAAIALGACAFVMSFVAALFGFIALQRSSRSARIMPVAFK